MATVETAPISQPTTGGQAFEKVEPFVAAPTKTPTAFVPEKHLAFEPPKNFTLLKELLLSEANAISPVAITDPFPLFSLEAVQEIRADLFRPEVVNKYGQRTKPGCYKMRGYSKATPFVDSIWRNPKTIEACSKAAGVDLAVVFDYEIGHINVQVDSLADDMALGDALPSATPPNQAAAGVPPPVDHADELASVGLWHTDSYPWVCVCMLSDPSNMVGGETGLRKGDGSVAKFRGPGIGWAVMMQGGCIEHIALKAMGTGERITMVTSFRPKNPLLKDVSNLGNVKQSSRWEELFTQWSTYRLEVIAERARILKEEILKGGLTGEEIANKVKEWNEVQFQYMKTTAIEMTGDGNPGSYY